MEDLKKLLGKKGKEEPDKDKLDAKMKVLQELRDMMSQLMGNGMMRNHDEMRKVAIMAKDKEGLQEGLEKAQEIVEQSPEELSEDNSDEEEESEEESY